LADPNAVLRAIVDTAGKSIHAWFDAPTGGQLAELQTILPALACDRAMFKLSQPCACLVHCAERIFKVCYTLITTSQMSKTKASEYLPVPDTEKPVLPT